MTVPQIVNANARQFLHAANEVGKLVGQASRLQRRAIRMSAKERAAIQPNAEAQKLFRQKRRTS
jgi:hypothetical protein